MRGNGTGGFKTCDNNTCTENGGIIAPGQKAIKTDRGTLHWECATPAEREQYMREQRAAALRAEREREARLSGIGTSGQPRSPRADRFMTPERAQDLVREGLRDFAFRQEARS